jgi:hypothetical protein
MRTLVSFGFTYMTPFGQSFDRALLSGFVSLIVILYYFFFHIPHQLRKSPSSLFFLIIIFYFLFKKKALGFLCITQYELLRGT